MKGLCPECETFHKSTEACPPFRQGDRVVIKGEEHLGQHVVIDCQWYVSGPGGVDPYWLVRCAEIREPIDWSKIPAGATGIVTSSGWQGSADHVEFAEDDPPMNYAETVGGYDPDYWQ